MASKYSSIHLTYIWYVLAEMNLIKWNYIGNILKFQAYSLLRFFMFLKIFKWITFLLLFLSEKVCLSLLAILIKYSKRYQSQSASTNSLWFRKPVYREEIEEKYLDFVLFLTIKSLETGLWNYRRYVKAHLGWE